MQAIAAASAPGVVYMTAERFTHGIAYAVRCEKMEDFREHLAGAEMLVLDDVQHLRGKTVQQEFRRALYSLLDGQLPILLAGDPLGAPVARRPATGMEAADMAAGFRADFDKPTGRLLIAGPGWHGIGTLEEWEARARAIMREVTHRRLATYEGPQPRRLPNV